MPALAIVDDDVARSPSGPSPEQLAERIDFVDEARKDSSRRLHVEIDELKRRFDAAQSRPVDVQRIRFSAPVLVAVVGGVVTIVLGMYGVTAGLRADSTANTNAIAAIVTRLDAREKQEATEKQMNDLRMETQTKTVDMLAREQKLMQLKLDELSGIITRQGARR